MPVLPNNHSAVATSPPASYAQYEYTYKPYETGIITYPKDPPSPAWIEVDEDSSLATMIASEAVLARDWDTPEEDEAWKDL